MVLLGIKGLTFKRLLKWLAAGIVSFLILAFLAFRFFDLLFPPDMSRLATLSTEVLDTRGNPLRIYLNAEGIFRLPVRVSEVDPKYLQLLIQYEDKRFYRHPGVDPLALIRALGQAVSNGEVISGGSTLTMQTVRLLEPRPRTLKSKLIEMFRALQLERRYSKDEILNFYLMLAPFGGNVEGVKAAAWKYFGKAPGSLNMAEAALLVVIPQAPNTLRPDLYPENAARGRNKILQRVGATIGLSPADMPGLLEEQISLYPHRLPMLAPHLSDRLRSAQPGQASIQTFIDGDLQRTLETLVKGRAGELDAFSSIAILVLDNRSHRVIAYVGSADFLDNRRRGQIDMITATRSPGSTLKPVIYGLAFDRGLAHPATLINDAPTQFGDYAPANFRARHFGEVSLTRALQLSLNVPAVAVLEKVGPGFLTARLRREGLTLDFGDPDIKPGLAMALGGVGMKLEDLTLLYSALATDGVIRAPVLAQSQESGQTLFLDRQPIMGDAARWYITAILKGVSAPNDLIPLAYKKNDRGISMKTGTSYGFRDAWAIGYDADYTVGVWVGRADGTPNPGRFGANTAAPVLVEVFNELPAPAQQSRPKPPKILPLNPAILSPGLKYFNRTPVYLKTKQETPPPRIVFPLDNTTLMIEDFSKPLQFRAEGGMRPYTWFVNGKAVLGSGWSRISQWSFDGPGFNTVRAVDARGRVAEIKFRLVPPNVALEAIARVGDSSKSVNPPKIE